MRRMLLGATGLLLGFLAALAVLAVLLGAEAATLAPQQALDLLAGVLMVGLAAPEAGWLAVWKALVAVALLPLVVVAGIGEATGLRAFPWYAGASGVLAAAIPALLRAGEGAGGRGALLLFLAGVAGGSTYWLVAGRTAGP